jgi:hypothetical protein
MATGNSAVTQRPTTVAPEPGRLPIAGKRRGGVRDHRHERRSVLAARIMNGVPGHASSGSANRRGNERMDVDDSCCFA